MKHLITLTLLIALPAWGSIHEDLALLARVKAMPEDAASTPYADAVNALSPIAYFKLHEDSPSGAASVVDSVGTYSGTPTGSLSTRWPGPTKDDDDYAMKSDGGHVALTSSLAGDMLDDDTWSVSFWMYANGSANFARMFGMSTGTKNIAANVTNSQVRASSPIGSMSEEGALHGWKHITITSDQECFIDGVYSGATESTSLNSTVAAILFARNDLSNVFAAWLAHFAVFDYALSEAQALALHDAGRIDDGERPDQRTLYWDGEDMVATDSAQGLGLRVFSTQGASILSSSKARSGTKSLLADDAFRSAKIWHDLPYESWAPLTEGTVRFWINYNTLPSGSHNYCFIDGKTGDSGSPLDSNESHVIEGDATSYTFNVAGTQAVVTPSPALVVDTWYEVIARWRTDATGGANNVEISVNGQLAGNASVPDIATVWSGVGEFHSILFGNDLTGSSPDYHLDDFEMWNYWNDSL